MEFFKLIEKRQSTRKFQKKPVGKEKLTKILEAINSAPSAGNLQAYDVIVIEDKATREKLAEAALGQEFIVEAPVALVFCTNSDRTSFKYGRRGRELYCIQDATIACAYAQLAATSLGLASVWVGAFSEAGVSTLLSLTDNLKPVAILPIGYAAEEPKKTPRRKLGELVKKRV